MLDYNMTEFAAKVLPDPVTDLCTEQKIHVLRVDDDEDFLIISKRYLEQQGPFHVENVLSVKEALERIEHNDYDVIISDYHMPILNGLDFLKQLRSMNNDIPFILFTSEYREETAIEALNLGAYGYFHKYENDLVYVELAHSIKEVVKTKSIENEVQSLAKFPSENPNPVLRSTKDGSIIYANKAAKKMNLEVISGNKLVLPDVLMRSVTNSLHSNLIKEIEVTHEDKKISFVVTPIPEEGYANIYGRDITESDAAWTSLEQTFDELVRINEKLGVVGRLTRHDARNKLTVILNNIYLAKLKSKKDQAVLPYLQSIETAVDQMNKIFEFARAYEMLGIEELECSNVQTRFNQAVGLFSNVEHIKFECKCSGLTVLADSLLMQLFYNLIHNSLVHGKKVTKIRVNYEMEKDQLKLIYEDNGVGIPEDEKIKIFGEGYGKGTGYGLYLIKKICEAYGWEITETGVPQKGTCFVMTIPKLNNDGKSAYDVACM